jgi:hypothetical protein
MTLGFLEKPADMVSPADRADSPDDFPRLVDSEAPGQLEFREGPEEMRLRRAQIQKIDQSFFRRGDFSGAFSRELMSEEERGVDMVNGNRPQVGAVRFCPVDGNGIKDGGDLRDHPMMVEGRLKRHVARVGCREVFRKGQEIYPVLESPSAPAQPRQVSRSGQPRQQLARVSVSDAQLSKEWGKGCYLVEKEPALRYSSGNV